ncbi:U2 small nuclear ribonucleoprotein A'-like [Dendronephthya gigantea]|uniref:U2 small nuclear ribonucleoprotein A'-like n=1 Tax=Dendronephthya gigantea TaxID=151771 RepID=UPI00106AF1DD|nr:U2 small nuclear ribonucleoprotein A'-like [Dendronephthya gigantea]XP_028408757.1 U2 small nuclear ribonucleoprotein A'-like [Dendronephthya gigantea]
MKLTADLILQSAQFTNALKDRELDLRGYKIPVIENLGATLDQFDTINFSDNDIKKLEGFPLLKRLKCLLLNNNRVCRIGEGLETCLPNLETLVLTNNSMQDLSDLETLKSVKSLRYLSLMRNPILNKPNYRLYVIHSLPQLRVLDFQRIKQREREAAARMFSGKKGEKLVNGAMKSKTNKFVPGAPLVNPPAPPPKNPQRNNIAAIKAAIANAKSLEEVQKLEMMLKTGHVPETQEAMAVDKS